MTQRSRRSHSFATPPRNRNITLAHVQSTLNSRTSPCTRRYKSASTRSSSFRRLKMSIEVPARLKYPEESYRRISDFLPKSKSQAKDGVQAGQGTNDLEAEEGSELGYPSDSCARSNASATPTPTTQTRSITITRPHGSLIGSQFMSTNANEKRATLFRQLASAFRGLADLEDSGTVINTISSVEGPSDIACASGSDILLYHHNSELTRLTNSPRSSHDSESSPSGQSRAMTELVRTEQEVETKGPISLRYVQRAVSPEL